MGLQFYFGGSGAGKSRQLHERILQLAEKEPERSFLFLVPEQFTMQTQVDLVTASTCGGIMNIDVLSFGRLAHRVFEQVGYDKKPVLDDTGKSLVLRRVAAELKDEMPVIGSNLNKIGYIHEVKSALSEFMQYGLTPAKVGELSEFAKGRGKLHYKLKDLEVIYQGFQEYIRDKFITTEETLGLLTRAVKDSALIKGSVIVFDGFTGFTPIQYQLIQELMRFAGDVIVSVTLDAEEEPAKDGGEQELFYLSKKTVRDLCRLAKEAGVVRMEDVVISHEPLPRFQDSRRLAHLEKHLFRYPLVPYREEEGEQMPGGGVSGKKARKVSEKVLEGAGEKLHGKEDIQIVEALNPAEEVRWACIQIKKLVLEEGYQYRDIGVVAGELPTYADYIEREALVYDIPFFVDRTRGLVLNPFIEYIRSALKVVLENFSYETVFHYLRCGLADFEQEEIDLLENYVLALGIRGRKKWSQAFVNPAVCQTEKEQCSEKKRKELEKLEKLNDVRERLMQQLSPLLSGKKTAEEMVRTLYEFIVAGRIQEKLVSYEQYFKENGEPERGREYAQIYRLVMELLEQVVALLGEEEISLQEFADILDAGFQEIEVGTIPGSVDRIVAGDVERTRLKQVKVLFFLGVNDGNIPKGSSKGGIISDIDREFLQSFGVELAPTPRQQMHIQRLYLYMNLTKPSGRLYLSYSRISSQGKSLRPSYLIDTMGKLFPDVRVKRAGEEEHPFERLVGKKDGLTLLARELSCYAIGREGELKENELLALYGLYNQDIIYKKNAGKLAEAAFERYQSSPLAKAVATALYGKLLENSVSRLERYASCAYAHFLQYGLMLKEREEFSFEAVDLGNIYHQVLENFAGKLSENHYTWFDFPKEEGERLLKEALQECTASYGETVLYSNARYEYMIERMYRILKRTISTLQAQLRDGSFVPEAFEFSFDRVDQLEAVNIALSDEEKMHLRGRIDRIDTCEDEEHIYVKVIDYKSGAQKFDLAALYYGLQLQLVVYMNVAEEAVQKKHPDKKVCPAALLYYHVADPMVTTEQEMTPEELNGAILKELRMSGLVSQDERVVSLLDGKFSDRSMIIPVERKKDGSFSARSGVIAREDYETVSAFVDHKIRQFGREILAGNVEKNPCRKQTHDSCSFCAFKGVCDFEPGIPGYEKRILEAPPEDELLLRMKKELQEQEG